MTTSPDIPFDFSGEFQKVISEEIAAYAPSPRTLYSWFYNPISAPGLDETFYDLKAKKFLHEQFIDALCADLCHLPSMAAAIELYPDICSLPIHAWYPQGDDKSCLGMFDSARYQAAISFESGDYAQHVPLQKSTLPHELRHGVFHLAGGMRHFSNMLADGDYMHALALLMVMEADAVAFGIAVSMEYELINGDMNPIQQVSQVRTPSTIVYYNKVREDIESHWDGSAANAAFNAYLSEDNKSVLDHYNEKLCRLINKYPAKFVDKRPWTEEGEKMRRERFDRAADIVRTMPYIGGISGILRERPLYLSGINLDPVKLTTNLRGDLNTRLIQARLRDLSQDLDLD